MVEIDPAFFQAPEHRPKPETISADNIPLIDLSLTNNSLESLIEQIGDACKNWGFFQVTNHGVPSQVRERAFSASREFFHQEKEQKKKVSRDEVNPYGYYDTEHTKNVRDWKEVFDFTVQNPTIIPLSSDPGDDRLRELVNQWPVIFPEMREACEAYSAEMQKVGTKLMELIALSLGLARDRFHGFFEDQTTFIRLNHYPPCPVPDLALGVGRHKDAGVLTILAQDDVGGLQVKRKSDGEWILVKPALDAYIINVGDIIQVWSNDRYESVEHRVKVNSERERFSIPFFMNPSHHSWIEPVKELLNEENPAKYKAYNFGKFFAARKLSNYKKLDVENVQVLDFKVV